MDEYAACEIEDDDQCGINLYHLENFEPVPLASRVEIVAFFLAVIAILVGMDFAGWGVYWGYPMTALIIPCVMLAVDRNGKMRRKKPKLSTHSG
jgi:hypothetical protein